MRGTENANRTPWENPLLPGVPFQRLGKLGEGRGGQGGFSSGEVGTAGILNIRIRRRKDREVEGCEEHRGGARIVLSAGEVDSLGC